MSLVIVGLDNTIVSVANPTSTYEIRPIALYVPDARPDAPTQVIKAY